MTDEDDQPITVKLSVRNAENPLWEAADKLKRLISDIQEVAMINASYQRAIAAERMRLLDYRSDRADPLIMVQGM
jgi:hypothetical protein